MSNTLQRRIVVLIAALAVAGGALAFVVTRPGRQGLASPQAVVDAFITHVAAGDSKAAAALFHERDTARRVAECEVRRWRAGDISRARVAIKDSSIGSIKYLTIESRGPPLIRMTQVSLVFYSNGWFLAVPVPDRGDDKFIPLEPPPMTSTTTAHGCF